MGKSRPRYRWQDLSLGRGNRLFTGELLGKERWLRGDTAEVGSYPEGASPYGALDMAGNVWEYVADWYDPLAYDDPAVQSTVDPELGDYRVQRGGSWGYTEWNQRASNRLMGNTDASYHDFGFRCALSAQESQ